MIKIKSIEKPVDGISLYLFRILFGLLIVAECWGAIFTGWVSEVLVEPKFLFTFYGFEWTAFIVQGKIAYFWFILMGVLGWLIAFGRYYKWSVICFTLIWSIIYFSHKAGYNNHYYLLCLIGFLMSFVQADGGFVYNSKKHLKIPKWNILIFKWIICIVFVYAAVAKLYPDWYNAAPMKLMMQSKSFPTFLEGVFKTDHFAYFLSYSGIIFDFLIIPMLFYKPTRNVALVLSLIFHLFNSIVFQIGIFPYFALSFILFFYPKETLYNRFKIKKRPITNSSKKNHFGWVLILFFTLQLLLPLRHWLIPGDVLITEEGHRCAWRMMLRHKTGSIFYTVYIDDNQKHIFTSQYASSKQSRTLIGKPDMIWQLAQIIGNEYQNKYPDKKIKVTANSFLNINGKNSISIIQPYYNLYMSDFNYFGNFNFLQNYK